MRRLSIKFLVSTLLAMTSSIATFAQDATPSPTLPNTTQTMSAPNATLEDSQSAVPADRVEAECRDWAVQDGVPENELADYVNECVEDRAVQE